MKHLTTIPFTGFYETSHSAALDDCVEQFFQYDDHGNSNIPDDMHFSTNYHSWFIAYATNYADAFNEFFKDEIGIDLGLEFESLESPKEYNFTTDRIFCHIGAEALQRLYDKVTTESLSKRVEARFTSRDGFASFYPSSLAAWPGNVMEYDHNQVDTLIEAVLIQELGESYEDKLTSWDLMERYACNGYYENWLCECLSPEAIEFADRQREAGKPLEFKKAA